MPSLVFTKSQSVQVVFDVELCACGIAPLLSYGGIGSALCQPYAELTCPCGISMSHSDGMVGYGKSMESLICDLAAKWNRSHANLNRGGTD